MKRRIIVDGTTIVPRMDGLTQYILNVVLHLDMVALAEFEVILLLNKKVCSNDWLLRLQKKGISVKYVNIPPIGPARDIKFLIYFLMHKKKSDIFYVCSNQWPIFLKKGVFTIHDLIYERYPAQLGKFKKLKRFYLRLVTKNGLKSASTVIAVSAFTKSEIVRCYPAIRGLEAKIKVVYEGFEHLVHLNTSADIAKPFSKYFFYVGSSRGHKNLSGLLEAISLLRESLPDDYGFVIVGDMSRLNFEQSNLIKSINRFRKVIHVSGWVTDDVLATLFSQATASIFPSFCEGFGIPILESFYLRVPLICSDCTALPEVAGDAAMYFDPSDPKSIAQAITFFLSSADLVKKQMIERGLMRLNHFSWVKAALTVSNEICMEMRKGC